MYGFGSAATGGLDIRLDIETGAVVETWGDGGTTEVMETFCWW